MLHAIAERVGHDARVVAKIFGEVAIRPPAGILERLRQIPMIERHPRLDIAREHLVNHAPVKIEPLLINRSLAVRHDPRPRQRNPRRIKPKLSHQPNVIGIAMVKIASHVARIPMLNLPRRVRKPIPDGFPFPSWSKPPSIW